MSDKVPSYLVKISGKELDAICTNSLNSIKVDLRRQAPSSVEIQLRNDTGDLADKDEFKPGSPVVIKLGYRGAELTQVFEGEIIGNSVSLEENQPRIFRVRAFDYMHRLTRGRKVRTFLEQKFSDIVSTVASDHGLSGDTEDTVFKRDYVIQHNQTDMDFARAMAGWLDYDFQIRHLEDASTLRFKKPEVQGSPALKAVYEKPNLSADEVFLRRFDGRQNLTRVVSKVIVRGWDPAQKKEIVGESTTIYGNMEGSSSAADEVKNAWQETDRQLVDYKVFSQEEADKIAETKLNEYARTFITADMETKGDARLFAGGLIAVERVSEKFDGNYLCEQVTHFFSSKVKSGGGYMTRIVAARCGW